MATKTKKRTKKYNPIKPRNSGMIHNHGQPSHVLDFVNQSITDSLIVSEEELSHLRAELKRTYFLFEYDQAVLSDLSRVSENAFLFTRMIKLVQKNNIAEEGMTEQELNTVSYVSLTCDMALQHVETVLMPLVSVIAESFYVSKGYPTKTPEGFLEALKTFGENYVEIASFITSGMFMQCVRETTIIMNDYSNQKTHHVDMYRILRSMRIMHKARKELGIAITDDEFNSINKIGHKLTPELKTKLVETVRINLVQ